MGVGRLLRNYVKACPKPCDTASVSPRVSGNPNEISKKTTLHGALPSVNKNNNKQTSKQNGKENQFAYTHDVRTQRKLFCNLGLGVLVRKNVTLEQQC